MLREHFQSTLRPEVSIFHGMTVGEYLCAMRDAEQKAVWANRNEHLDMMNILYRLRIKMRLVEKIIKMDTLAEDYDFSDSRREVLTPPKPGPLAPLTTLEAAILHRDMPCYIQPRDRGQWAKAIDKHNDRVMGNRTHVVIKTIRHAEDMSDEWQNAHSRGASLDGLEGTGSIMAVNGLGLNTDARYGTHCTIPVLEDSPPSEWEITPTGFAGFADVSPMF